MTTVFEALIARLRWMGRTANKRRKVALVTAAVVALLSALGVRSIQDRYEAKARIFVDTQTVLKPLMSGLTLQPDIDDQVRMLARTLISRSNIERLIQTPGLQFDVPRAGAHDDLAYRLMDQIKIEPTVLSNLYEITYRGTTPAQALSMVEATLNLFANAGTDAKIRDAQGAGRFIDEQIRDYEAKLVEAENRRRDFRLRTASVSGVSAQEAQARVVSLNDELGKMQLAVAATGRARDFYRTELSTEEPQLPADATVKTVDPVTELAVRRRGLEELRLRFTDQHPDVIGARRAVEQLEEMVNVRQEAQQKAWTEAGKPGIAVIAPTSPIYQKLRVSLADAEAENASVRSQVVAQQKRLDEARALAAQAPEVEVEMAQLNRDYDVLRKNYEALVARRESASLGKKVDESLQLAEFRVIDPPRVSTWPKFPGRWQLVLMGLALSLAAGVGAAMVVESAWPTLDEPALLQRLSGRPVLGIVPIYRSKSEQRAHVRGNVLYASATVLFLMLQCAWVAWSLLQLRAR